ncbi:MAG TPA: DUF2235 domain-containing protein [Panacibacter sp.]|nr:DUF2235 domain-containing protein [Panacibacter sp.]
MIDIVICVDGTNSQGYKNRSVENFYRAVHAEHKIYKPGPQNTVTGSDWVSIRDQIVKELNVIAQKYGEDTFFNGYNCTIAKKNNFRFIMVGHSRGGHTVIHLAGMLKYRTHFMGLYDAVDRTNLITASDTRLISNVDHIYHAVRDISVGSRTSKKFDLKRVALFSVPGVGVGFTELASYGIAKALDFGNTGTQSADGGEYVAKTFKTSHGGIGGDVLTSQLFSMPATDDSCAITLFNQSEAQVKKTELCISESYEADRFIKEGARKYGVRI